MVNINASVALLHRTVLSTCSIFRTYNVMVTRQSPSRKWRWHELGSSRLRLCREQVTESLLICLIGGALGLLLAIAATRWLTTRWTDMPRADSIHLDATVIIFAIGITFLSGMPRGTSSSAFSNRQRIAGGIAGRITDRRQQHFAHIVTQKPAYD